MNYSKINKMVLDNFTKPQINIVYLADRHEIAVLNKDNTAIYLVPEVFFPFDIDKCCHGTVTADSLAKFLDPLPDYDKGLLSNDMRYMRDGKLCRLAAKLDKTTAYIDHKLCEPFNGALVEVCFRTETSPVQVYENGNLIAVLMPIRP